MKSKILILFYFLTLIFCSCSSTSKDNYSEEEVPILFFKNYSDVILNDFFLENESIPDTMVYLNRTTDLFSYTILLTSNNVVKYYGMTKNKINSNDTTKITNTKANEKYFQIIKKRIAKLEGFDPTASDTFIVEIPIINDAKDRYDFYNSDFLLGIKVNNTTKLYLCNAENKRFYEDHKEIKTIEIALRILSNNIYKKF